MNSPYQAALDDIYATFMRVKHLNKGRFDRDARQPQRLLDIASQRGLLPPTAHTLKVSGSKGKGTTARIAARILQNELPDRKIGLFVSPEEDDHYDRMRINGIAMTPERFVHHYTRLKPQLLRAEAQLRGPEYLSPLGIFLLIALDWFKDEGVDYFVLECGRGVAHDEVGQIPSKVGVLTSIMLEHADKLGPTLADVARDKLSLLDTCALVNVLEPVALAAKNYAPFRLNALRIITTVPYGIPNIPLWLEDNAQIADIGVLDLLDDNDGPSRVDAVLPHLTELSTSFGLHAINGHNYVFEGLIHTDSLDQALHDCWQQQNILTNVVASFPDDKDREQLLAAFRKRRWPITECILTGTRGYLDYARTVADESSARATFAFDDVAGFAAWLAARPASQLPGRTYLVGTQTYIRLVRKALALMAQPGGHHAQP
jgi:hypothetical protein